MEPTVSDMLDDYLDDDDYDENPDYAETVEPVVWLVTVYPNPDEPALTRDEIEDAILLLPNVTAVTLKEMP
jgi:hypothetical protein